MERKCKAKTNHLKTLWASLKWWKKKQMRIKLLTLKQMKRETNVLATKIRFKPWKYKKFD